MLSDRGRWMNSESGITAAMIVLVRDRKPSVIDGLIPALVGQASVISHRVLPEQPLILDRGNRCRNAKLVIMILFAFVALSGWSQSSPVAQCFPGKLRNSGLSVGVASSRRLIASRRALVR